MPAVATGVFALEDLSCRDSKSRHLLNELGRDRQTALNLKPSNVRLSVRDIGDEACPRTVLSQNEPSAAAMGPLTVVCQTRGQQHHFDRVATCKMEYGRQD